MERLQNQIDGAGLVSAAQTGSLDMATLGRAVAAKPATLDKINSQAAHLQGQCHQLKVQLDSLLAELCGDDRSSGQVEAGPDYPPSRLDQIEMKQTDAQNVIALCSTLVGDIREMLFDQNRTA